MPEIVVLNSRAVPPRSAMIPLDDWAVRYGWGLFETLRIHRGCPLFLDRHLARMCGTAPLLELTDNSEYDKAQWQRDVLKALERASMKEGIINLYWTRGSLLARVRPSRVVRIRPLPRYPKGPLRLWVAPWRIEPTYPGSGVKTLAYFPYIFAGLAARREGFDEALVLNTSDRVADGAASSIFVVANGKVLTPSLDQGTLAGVTRSVVLGILHQLKIPHRETKLSWKSVMGADEIFVTSSLRGLVPVSAVAELWRKKRVDKSVTRKLAAAHKSAVADFVTSWRREH